MHQDTGVTQAAVVPAPVSLAPLCCAGSVGVHGALSTGKTSVMGLEGTCTDSSTASSWAGGGPAPLSGEPLGPPPRGVRSAQGGRGVHREKQGQGRSRIRACSSLRQLCPEAAGARPPLGAGIQRRED